MPKNITPMERLTKRIKKEFCKKRLIGDIAINDEEFELLKIYLRERFIYMYNNSKHVIYDEMFCAALVQIGIRFYDGKFWPHVKEIISRDEFNSNHHSWFGKSFVDTLILNGKSEYEEGNWMNSILMHCFVSNDYAKNFFSFLFAFYRIDLDRDISRLDRDTMNDLIEIMKRNDNSGRTYWLVEHTADAVRNNTRGAKTRIRRYLKLIDKAFWGDPLPENSENRLTKLFLDWTKTSDDFISEKKNQLGPRKHGRKSFASPYIKFNTGSFDFDLVLPQQIIRFDDFNDLYWKICIGDKTKFIEINPYSQGVTGYKTDEERIELGQTDIFSPITAELFNSSERIRLFKIAAEPIRFFDDEGDYINTESVPTGEVFSFTPRNFKPESEAILESERMGELLYTRFDFVEGDIVRFPDGKPISVGRKLQEGLLPRGIISGVHGIFDEKKIPVYSSVPTIFIKTSPKKINGTAFSINGKKTHISDENGLCAGITKFDLLDRSGDCGYLFDLSFFGCKENGIYNIEIDVPNDRSIRNWNLAYIKDFSYEFEDAPYIFKTRGTLSIPKRLEAKPVSKMSLEQDEINDYFNFDIFAEENKLQITVSDILLEFEIPMLSYAFADAEWETALHEDIWHSEFEPRIFVKYPSDKIKFFIEEDDDEDSDDDCSVEFIKNKSSDMFECDLNKFKSWFGHEKARKILYLELPDVKGPLPFLGIVMKSFLISAMLQGDFDKDVLIGNFDIIGKAEYYADIIYNGKVIAEKEPINNGKIVFDSELETGKYEVRIFESEEDEFGFGDNVFYEIGRKELDLINPLDLNGKSIVISSIYPAERKNAKLSLGCTYRIQRLKSISKEDKHNYRGTMVVESKFGNVLSVFPVNVEIFDFSKLYQAYITFVEDGDNLEFLYDEARMSIVKEEDSHLTKSQAYRRYKQSLYPEDYIFNIDFTEEKSLPENFERYFENNHNKNIVSKTDDEIKINSMGFSSKTYHSLVGCGIETAEKISEYTFKELLENKNLKKSCVCEIIEKMEYFGFTVWARKRNAELAEFEKPKYTNISKDFEELVMPKTINDSKHQGTLLSTYELSPMAYNCLRENNIWTFEELTDFIKARGIKGLQNLNKMNSNLRDEIIRFVRLNVTI